MEFTELLSESRKIISTAHSLDRAKDDDRFGKVIAKDFGTFDKFKAKVDMVIRRAIKKIMRNHKDERGQYGVHSKSTGIGVILDWRPDASVSDNNNHAVIVTLLPVRNSHSYKPGTTEVVVENQTFELVNFIEVE